MDKRKLLFNLKQTVFFAFFILAFNTIFAQKGNFVTMWDRTDGVGISPFIF